MRSLVQKRLLLTSIPGGVFIALACMPLIVKESPQPTLRLLQLLMLPGICVLLIQSALAWTPERMLLRPGCSPDLPRRRWFELALLAVVVAAARLALDPLLQRLVPIIPISSWGAFARKLPFSVLVQPLVMVVAVYVFTLRLSHSARLANAAVILFHQGIVVLQFASGVKPSTLAILVVIAGFDGLAGAWSYHRYGVTGTIAVAAAAFSRHACALISS